jgi:hypothetical protein
MTGRRLVSASPRIITLGLIAALIIPAVAHAKDKKKPGEWVLIDRRGAARIYNYYESADDDVPKYKIEGLMRVPYEAAVEIIWDEDYEYPDFISDWMISAQRVSEPDQPRRDLVVYDVPRFVRLAVRLGSIFRGTLGRYQYTTLELKKEVDEEMTRITWTRVPTPDNHKPDLKKAYEVVRNNGYWELRALSTDYTRYTYMLDGYPGGANVPPRIVRWGNKIGLGFGSAIEARYRDLQEKGRY